MKTVKCPNCKEIIPFSKIGRFCNQCGSQLNGRAFFPFQKHADQLKCKAEGCTGTYAETRCPCCGYPFEAHDHQVFVSLVGPAGSGKTSYTLAVIHELQKDWHAVSDDPQTADDIKQMFSDDRIPCATAVGSPVIRQIHLPGLIHSPFAQEKKNAYLYFFDRSGEDAGILLHEKQASDLHRSLKSMDLLMIVLDPVLVFRNETDCDYSDPSIAAQASMLRHCSYDDLSLLFDQYRKMNRLETHKKIDLPVAVVFAKADILNDQGIQDQLSRPSSNPDMLSDIDRTDAYIRQLFADRDIRLTDVLNTHLSNWKYFCSSSYGHAPASHSSRIGGAEPRRVLDPLVWYMKQNGIG